MLRRLLLPFALLLVFAPQASAAGGRYVFDGGTRAEQGQVTAALNASSFDWNVVPGPITIHIGASESPRAASGQIWLDAHLLDSGRFAWGVVQHEYAHQIDFAVLTDGMRERLHTLLGGSSWWGSGGAHAELDSERFADAVAWSYWPSPDNVMKPNAGAVSPTAFRATLAGVLGLQPVRTTASVERKRPHQKG